MAYGYGKIGKLKKQKGGIEVKKIIIILIFLLATAANAETYHVDASAGSDTNDGLTKATAFVTIQHGIDVADDGDTVEVWPGIYDQACSFNGKAITVTSAADAAIVRSSSGYGKHDQSTKG